MRLIAPTPINAAVLTSSNVVENDRPAWNNGTTYAADAEVISTTTHRIYRSTLAGNVANDPTLPGTSKWTDIGPTNKWAMFDGVVGSSRLPIGDNGSIYAAVDDGHW